MPDYTIGPTDIVYMDGSAVYSIRQKGYVGIAGTLRLFATDYAILIRLGLFDEYTR